MDHDTTARKPGEAGDGRGARRILFLDPQPFFQCRGSPIRVAADVRTLAADGYQVDLLAMPVGEAVDLPASVRLLRVPNLFGIRSMAIGPSAR